MTGHGLARLLSRHGKWTAFAATMAAFAISAAPAAAVMVRLPNGSYANYEALGSHGSGGAASNFDDFFTNLDYSGGPVMPSNTNYAVVWQPSNYSGTPFQSSGSYTYGYVAGVQKFMQDMAADSGHATNVDSVSSQYNDTTGAHAAYSFAYGGALPVDTDPLPANGCPAFPGDICITDAQIQNELNTFLSAHGLPADFSHEYYLITPPDVASCFDSLGTAGCSANADPSQDYCAYHSRTATGYIYANIPDVSGVQGCDPFVSNPPYPSCPSGATCKYDNGPADGVLSALSHEHNESITDPEPNNAWTDWGTGQTGEIGDKCNNDGFRSPNLNLQSNGSGTDTPFNQSIGGDHYLIQREWSNQTHRCLDAFTSNGTSVTAGFTDATVSGSTESFTASGQSSLAGPVRYVWQFNDGPASQNGQASTVETTTPTVTHTFAAAGPASVALTVMAADGTSVGTAHSVYVGGTAPTAVVAAGSGLEGTPILFSSAGSSDPTPGATITSYTWTFSDGGTASGPAVAHSFAHSGPYTASLVETDSYGQVSAVASAPVTVTDEAPTVAFNAPSAIAGRPVTLAALGSDPDGSITATTWNFGDGHLGSGTSTTHTYTSPGHYIVTVTVTDASGQSASAAHPLTVAPAPCVVPGGLKGDTLAKARAALGRAQCSVGKVKSPKKPRKGPGKHRKWVLLVASASPGRGAVRPHGAKVALTLTWKAVHN